MNLFSQILLTLVGIEFGYIMYLETIAPTSAATLRVFGLTADQVANPLVQNLMRNQGIYNGVIGVAVILTAWLAPVKWLAASLMLGIICVAAYGSLTVKKDIIIKQAGLAIVSLVSLLW